MKKFLLGALAVCFAISLTAQQNFKVKVREVGAPQQFSGIQAESQQSVDPLMEMPVIDYKSGTPSRAVDIRNLGGAGNSWGLSSGNRTYMWADNDLNSVVFAHRMLSPPGTGFIGYDVSTDNGETWTVNQQIWDPSGYPYARAEGDARYPQAVIYNPSGNTNPDNAVISYLAPTLDQTNGDSWGGQARGTNYLTTVDPTDPKMQGHPSPGGDYLQAVSDAYHITTQGLVISVEPVIVDGLFDNYTGNMLITSGYFNETTGLIDYEQSLLEFPLPEGVRVTNTKVAFAPDGNVGYIAVLSNNGENDVAEGSYYPILFKTTDGGENWDGPYNVQLGGPDGIPCILNYLSDEFLEYIYEPPIPERTELNFTTAFDFDMAVDAWGNPHLGFIVGLRGSDEWSIATGWEGLPGTGNSIAMVHITSYDDLASWTGDTLDLPYTFRGTFTGTNDLDEDVRPNVSITPDGTKVFFSWINSTITEENTSPDIYCIGHDIANHSYSEIYNVTAFTSVMWQAYMGSGSYYVFDYGDNYEIPFVCQLMNPTNNSDPVEFRYIDNFVLTQADLGFYVSNQELDQNVLTVSQNYPNPCAGISYFNITVERPINVDVEISNLIGQTIRTYQYGNIATGRHKLALDATGLDAGIYFYTVTAGKQRITKKMIIE